MLEKIVYYFQNRSGEFWRYAGQHIGVSLLALMIALIITVPLGILLYRYRIGRTIGERLFGFLRIVPSLAVLAFLIPLMGSGIRPALVALVILAMPPILINTIQAFLNLPADLIEGARGMGMSDAQIFFRVKLPLAFPQMFAGIRTAAVEIVASATIASYIGAGGLGVIIFSGLNLLRYDLLIIGGGAVAILSLATGFVLDQLLKYMTRYRRA
ncbi:MAG: ABC transporter permease [Lachnospiraceae bacterium]|nr:ABC transporter permease [Lachnospiraceae bacterium]